MQCVHTLLFITQRQQDHVCAGGREKTCGPSPVRRCLSCRGKHPRRCISDSIIACGVLSAAVDLYVGLLSTLKYCTGESLMHDRVQCHETCSAFATA
jgi:hypothetical protein